MRNISKLRDTNVRDDGLDSARDREEKKDAKSKKEKEKEKEKGKKVDIVSPASDGKRKINLQFASETRGEEDGECFILSISY